MMPISMRMPVSLTGEEGITVTSGAVYTYPVHSHSYYEMIFYLPFAGSITVNDRRIEADAPFVVLMTPSDLHGITVREGSGGRFIKFAFTADRLGGWLTRQLDHAVLVSPVEADSPFAALLRRAEAQSHGDAREIFLRCAVLLAVTEGEMLPSPPGGQRNYLAAEAAAIINDEFDTELTLRDLARRLNVSYQHLSACFSVSMGVPFSAYLADIRLRRAHALMLNTDLRITEICYACGYRSLSHFLRSFKKKFGLTPKALRSSGQAGQEDTE